MSFVAEVHFWRHKSNSRSQESARGGSATQTLLEPRWLSE